MNSNSCVQRLFVHRNFFCHQPKKLLCNDLTAVSSPDFSFLLLKWYNYVTQNNWHETWCNMTWLQILRVFVVVYEAAWMEDNFWWYYWFGCSLCCRLHLSLISWFWGGPVLNFHMKCIKFFWNTPFCLENLLSRAHSHFMFYDKLMSNFDNTYANTQASLSRLPSSEGCSNKLLEVRNINATIDSR